MWEQCSGRVRCRLVLGAVVRGGCCRVTGGTDPAASWCCGDGGLGSSPASPGRQCRLSCRLWGSPMAPEATLSWGCLLGAALTCSRAPCEAGTAQVTGMAGGRVWVEAERSPQPWASGGAGPRWDPRAGMAGGQGAAGTRPSAQTTKRSPYVI